MNPEVLKCCQLVILYFNTNARLLFDMNVIYIIQFEKIRELQDGPKICKSL